MWGSSIQSNHLFGPQLQVSNQTQIQFKSRLHQATWHKNTIPHCGETWLCALWPGAWCSYWRGSHHSDTHLLPGEDPEVWCWRKPVCARRRRSRQTIQWPGRERSKGCVSGFTINQSTTNWIELNYECFYFQYHDWLVECEIKLNQPSHCHCLLWSAPCTFWKKLRCLCSTIAIDNNMLNI